MHAETRPIRFLHLFCLTISAILYKHSFRKFFLFVNFSLHSLHSLLSIVLERVVVACILMKFSYILAGCVLRMFSNALSEKTFVKGLQKYLTVKYDKLDDNNVYA